MKWFHFAVQSGSPIQHGPHRITPRAMIAWLRIPWPGGSTALYINRPISVEVQTGDSAPQQMRVINVTRLAIIACYAAASIAAITYWRVTND